jgi:hypothetical protein
MASLEIHKVFILLGLVQQFNNISVISWWLDLFAEETEIPGETTNLPQVTDSNTQLLTLG